VAHACGAGGRKEPLRRGLATNGRTAYCCLPLLGALVTKISEPIFNVPPIVLAIIGICILLLAGEELLLSNEEDITFLYYFAFVPARYDSSLLPAGSFPGGVGAQIWTFVTYALIHGDISHLGMNSVWFLPFGSAVARRFGNLRVIGFFVVTAAAGALAHLLTHWGEFKPMIGASAAVSGFMAGAIRFAFQHGGPLTVFRSEDPAAYLVPAAPLSAALRDPRILIFLLAWFGLNLLFGIGSVGVPGGDQSIAWQAHIGGFAAGLLLFRLFDPVPAEPPSAD
jgi:membrane associated rhomboid family serine protease